MKVETFQSLTGTLDGLLDNLCDNSSVHSWNPCYFTSIQIVVIDGCIRLSLLFFAEDLEPGSPSERLKEALSYRDKFQSLYLVSHCF